MGFTGVGRWSPCVPRGVVPVHRPVPGEGGEGHRMGEQMVT